MSMTYAEAVKRAEWWMGYLCEYAPRFRSAENRKALAVLRRAEKVMEAVEKLTFDGKNIGGGWIEWTLGDDEYNALKKAALRYREEEGRG